VRYRIPLIALAACSTSTYAIIPNTDQPALDLPAYYAEPGAQPGFWERLAIAFNKFYISPNLGYSNVQVTDISNTTVGTGVNPAVAITSFSDNTSEWGLGIGYHFRPTGIFNRLELEYMHMSGINYSANPLLIYSSPPPVPLSSIDSNITIQTLLLKTYWDFNATPYLVPFIQIGAGVAFNSADTNAQFTPVFCPAIVSNDSTSATNFAFDAGAGLRVLLNEHFSLHLGYEFKYLGNKGITWTVQTQDPNAPITLESGTIYSNSIVGGFTAEV
jgi:opacity protein-like surface antigen